MAILLCIYDEDRARINEAFHFVDSFSCLVEGVVGGGGGGERWYDPMIFFWIDTGIWGRL